MTSIFKVSDAWEGGHSPRTQPAMNDNRVPWLRRRSSGARRQKRLGAALGMPGQSYTSNLTGKCEHYLGETVTAVAISSDGGCFAATAMNKRVVCYSTVDGAEIASFTADAATTAVKCVGTGNRLRLVVGTFTGAHTPAVSVGRTPFFLHVPVTNTRLIGAHLCPLHGTHTSGDIRLYSVSQERELHSLKFASGGAVNCIATCAVSQSSNLPQSVHVFSLPLLPLLSTAQGSKSC